MRRPFLRSGSLLVALILATTLLAQPNAPKPMALLIGVTNYQNTGLNSLQFTVRDMRLLSDELNRQNYDVTLLENANASKANIETTLAKMIANRSAGQTLLVAMSGHGVQAKGKDGTEDAHFCPFGCDKADESTFVSLGQLVPKLGNKGPNLLLLDACRDDPKKSFSGNELQGKLPSRTAILFSCSAGQASWETNRMNKGIAGFDERTADGSGVFMHHVLEGLRGKAKNTAGEVTWSGLVDYVVDHVNDRAKDWLGDYAKREADRRSVSLADLEFQSPHELKNMNRSVVLAKAAAGPKPTPVGEPEASVSAGPKPGEEREFQIAPGVKMIFCWIPPGEAQLGSPKAEREEVMKQTKDEKEPDWLASEAEEVRPKYKSKKGFWLGKYEVTQQEWAAVMDGKTPSKFKGDRLPVEQVSWDDCDEFVKKLSAKSGANAVFGSAGKFVLPHEDEWEYACRGGSTKRQPYFFGDELNGSQANCDGTIPFGTTTKGDYLEKTTDVGKYASKSPHPWGLCDMHGNAREWCENLYSSEQNYRVLRGGSWGIDARYCRAAARYRLAPGTRGDYIGFRVCFRLD